MKYLIILTRRAYKYHMFCLAFLEVVFEVVCRISFFEVEEWNFP